eukprot:6857175-Prymnesium_polylepis.1
MGSCDSCDQVSGVKLQPCLAIPRTSIPIRGIVKVLMEYGALVALPAYRDPSSGEVRTGLLHLKNQGADMCELEQGTSLWVGGSAKRRASWSCRSGSRSRSRSRSHGSPGCQQEAEVEAEEAAACHLEHGVQALVTVAPVAPAQLDEWGSDDEKYNQKSDDDRRSSGCDYDEELWAQGVKPWDNDAGAVLDVLYYPYYDDD